MVDRSMKFLYPENTWQRRGLVISQLVFILNITLLIPTYPELSIFFPFIIPHRSDIALLLISAVCCKVYVAKKTVEGQVVMAGPLLILDESRVRYLPSIFSGTFFLRVREGVGQALSTGAGKGRGEQQHSWQMTVMWKTEFLDVRKKMCFFRWSVLWDQYWYLAAKLILVSSSHLLFQ